MREMNNGLAKYFIGKSYNIADWENIYLDWQHINAREFNDAYNLVKENI